MINAIISVPDTLNAVLRNKTVQSTCFFAGILVSASPEDVYFYDQYSKTNAMEDRARVFENFVGVTKDECRIHEYPKLKEKAKYIKERILKLYPSLKGSDIFKNLDG